MAAEEPVLKMEEAVAGEVPALKTGEAAVEELVLRMAVVAGELVALVLMMGDAVLAVLAHLVMEAGVALLSVRMKASWSWVVAVVFCQSAEAGLWKTSSTRMIEAAGGCCWMSFEDVKWQDSTKGLSGVLGPCALEWSVQLQPVVVVQKGASAPMVARSLVDMWRLGSLLCRYHLRAFSAWACRQQINHRAEGPNPSCRQRLGPHDRCCSSPDSPTQAGPGHPVPLAILESGVLLQRAGLPLPLLRLTSLQPEELSDRS